MTTNEARRMQKVATVSTGFITKEVMTQYNHEGFKFVCKLDFSKMEEEIDSETLFYTPADETVSNTTSEVCSTYWLQWTSEGYEYYSGGSIHQMENSFDPKPAPDVHRSLRFIQLEFLAQEVSLIGQLVL
jgi:hypothetical protein